MGDNAFARLSSFPVLEEAWKSLLKRTRTASKNTAGSDGKTINDFHRDDVNNLSRLSKKLRSGKFEFSTLRPHLIFKTNGKKRLICVPTVGDRVVQGALADFLAEKYAGRLKNNVSFGFVRKRSVQMATRIACEQRAIRPWVFKTDITAFFDSIPRDRLKAAVKRVVRERSLHTLLFDAIDCEIGAGSLELAREIDGLGIHAGVGLRQGMPLSPLLSNFLLLDFDKEIDKSGAVALRYADDLIFLCHSKSECFERADFCKVELAKLGLSIPAVEPGSKSVVYEPDQSAEFLGMELARHGDKYRLMVSDRQLDRLTAEIAKLGNIRTLLSRKVSLRTLGQALAGKRDGYLGAYGECANVHELKERLLRAEHKALTNIYGAELGIKLSQIGPNARTFLGLSRRA